MMAAMFLGTADVLGTQFVGWPVPGAKEMTESTMVLIVFGGLAYAQIKRSHIRVELIYAHMRSRMKRAMEVLADVAALIFFSFLFWVNFHEAIHSWAIREADIGLIQFPLYPARWALVVGTGILIFQLGLDFIDHVFLLEGKKLLDTPAVGSRVSEMSIQPGNDE
jgi:TRAP-type C4-dicarboxylate transport system permease small subunit